MASPATAHTAVRSPLDVRVPTEDGRPLDALRFDLAGSPALTQVVADHLRRLGARAQNVDTGETSGSGDTSDDADAGEIALGGAGFAPVTARTAWGARGSGIEDEATAQAATGVMAVHGRRHGAPRGLGVDLLATATGVLTVQGLLAGLVGQARGGPAPRVGTTADRAGLLAVSQYLAAAGADEPEAVEPAPADRRSPPPTASSSSWRRSTPGTGRRSGAPSRLLPTRYGRAGGPSSSGTPPPARRSRSPSTRCPGAGPGSASGRRPRSPARRCADCARSPNGPERTTAPPRGP